MSQDIYIIEDRPELIETCREIFQHEKTHPESKGSLN